MPQDALRYHPTPIVTAVADFIGLQAVDWSAVEVPFTSITQTPSSDEKMDIDADVLARLHGFLARHGTAQWDHIREHMLRGCVPAAAPL